MVLTQRHAAVRVPQIVAHNALSAARNTCFSNACHLYPNPGIIMMMPCDHSVGVPRWDTDA